MSTGRQHRVVFSLLTAAALAIGTAVTAGPSVAVVADVQVADVYTTKARYHPAETIPVSAEVINTSSVPWTGDVVLAVNHMEASAGVATETITLTPGEQQTVTLEWTAPNVDFRGYLARITAGSSAATTGIDVSSDWTRYPRYGYVSEFPVGQDPAVVTAEIDQLVRDYHLNALQYYDWMWRHEKVVQRDSNGNPTDTWDDWAGKTISRQVVRGYIDVGHARRVAAMPYAMSYAGLQDYEQVSGVSPTWGLFWDSAHQQQLNFDFGDTDPLTNLWLFSPADAGWQDHIVDEYVDQVETMDFDGVHIDQLGRRDNVYDFDGDPVDLENNFSSLVDAAKQRLTANDPTRNVTTFNIVNGARGGWAADDVTLNADQDFVYSEIWENSPTYQSLRNFVTDARDKADGKAMVLAAYMNYQESIGPRYEAEDATLNGVAVDIDHAGYTGSGFVDEFGDVGDYVEFTVTADETRDYALAFRYGNATGADVTRRISIDGQFRGVVEFGDRPQWDNWHDEAHLVTELPAGTHTIRVEAAEPGFINLDNLTLGVFDDDGVRLANAAIAASGASHIELGQGDQMLAHPYFPNHYKQMSNSLKAAMRDHYDFITAYENLLYDATPTDSGTQFAVIGGTPTSGDARTDTVWTALSRTAEYDVLHLVNLLGNDDQWRNAAGTPPIQTDLDVRYYLGPDAEPTGVYFASPDLDNGATRSLPYTTGTDSTGTYVSFTVPSLEYWDMIYIARDFSAPTGNVYEAEDATKTGVTVGSNHPGYTGSGFVDNFADPDTGVSFVVDAAVDGTYTLRFRYSNGGSPGTRAVVLDGEFIERPGFPASGGWGAWSTVDVPIQLSSGLHTVVLWRQPVDAGAINADSLTLTTN